GFDYFCGYGNARGINTIIQNDRVVAVMDPVKVQPLLSQKALEFLAAKAKGNQPFFLYMALATPHIPLAPSREFQGKSGAGVYGDWVVEGDHVVGQMMAALDRLNLTPNTLVIAASDNGATEQGSNLPLRGGKSSIWEGGHRIPFVVRWPGKVKRA